MLYSDDDNHDHDHDHAHDHEREPDYSFVTCGSVIKLRHVLTKSRLHSHEVNYGSGSGQQSVTGYKKNNDVNSLWVVKSGIGSSCRTGSLIKKGARVRLEHMSTQKCLHSHLHQSPLSGNQEVSCYGDGDGDTGDHWLVHPQSDYWKRGEVVRLQHLDTGKWLSSNSNTFSHPIPNQHEICAVDKETKVTHWVTEEGLYFENTQFEGDSQ